MRFNIGTRLTALVGASVLGMVVIAALIITQERNDLYAQRSSELQHIVEVATGIVAANHALAAAGVISEEEAKNRADRNDPPAALWQQRVFLDQHA